jgi:YidC/Oxa1 family membrane protein insertase
MEFFITTYNLFLFQPIFNTLIWLAENVPGKDFGVAVILLTVLIRLLSYPLGAKAVQAQKRLAELQPKMKEVQEKFKGKAEEQRKAMADLFKEAKINPFASFAPFIIQIPIFIVLYQIFSHGLDTERFEMLYSFIQAPENINTSFLGIVDLNEQSFPLALGAGILQFLQLKQMSPKEKKKKSKGGKPDFSSMMQKQMLYILPLLIVWIATTLPAAFGLYIATTTIFSIWQQWFITRKDKKKAEEGEIQTT